MKQETAELIETAASELGLDVSIRANYSGRGMFGGKTTGVVGSLPDIIQCIAQAAISFNEDSCGIAEMQTEFVRDLRVSIDNMGRDYIVY